MADTVRPLGGRRTSQEGGVPTGGTRPGGFVVYANDDPYTRRQKKRQRQGLGGPMMALPPTIPGMKGSIQNLGAPANYLATPIGLQGPGVTSQSLTNLMQLLQLHGATDPTIMNRQIVGAERGTQAAQQQARTSLAARGLGGGGFSDALLAAIGEGGQNRVADIRAEDARLAEERKRQDIMQILPFISQALQMAAISGDLRRTKKMNRSGGGLAALGNLANIASGFNWGNMGGGTGGGTGGGSYQGGSGAGWFG